MESMHRTGRVIAALVTIVVCGAIMTTTACNKMVAKKSGGMHETSQKKGPPPHAPAHGYRHKHRADDVELVFDSDRGVYIVVGFPGTYFFDGSYYRRDGKKWETTFRLSGSWDQIDGAAVPPGLLATPDCDTTTSRHPGKGVGHGNQKHQ